MCKLILHHWENQLHHKWTLPTSCYDKGAMYRRPHSLWFCFYEPHKMGKSNKEDSEKWLSGPKKGGERQEAAPYWTLDRSFWQKKINSLYNWGAHMLWCIAEAWTTLWSWFSPYLGPADKTKVSLTCVTSPFTVYATALAEKLSS